VYLRPDTIDSAFASLAAATAVRQEATLCLTSALVHHDLSDTTPFKSDIALPCGTHHPVGLAQVAWRSFDPTTFHIGRDHIDAGNGFTLITYSAERTIVDCFRLMHQEGSDVAYEALRRWVRRRRNSPAVL
jgi:predicted transcriptional regulator of viral defense system